MTFTTIKKDIKKKKKNGGHCVSKARFYLSPAAGPWAKLDYFSVSSPVNWGWGQSEQKAPSKFPRSFK